MKKTEIYLGIAAYILQLDNEGEKPLRKAERKEIRQAMKTALLMVDTIPEPIEPKVLANALANLLAYVVSNGKSTYAEKVNHLSDIVLRTRTILEMVDQTPVAEVLDMVHDKKNHPFLRVFRKLTK